MSWSILSITINFEQDVTTARQRAKQIAGLIGFDIPDQTRIATAVSEIARNTFNYAGGGRVEFQIEGRTAPQVLLIEVKDQGPGVADLPAILRGESSKTGLGIASARRLMDQFEIESTPGTGTSVRLRKILPKKAPLITKERLQEIATQLVQQRPRTPLEEIQQQNRELLYTLEELNHRQEELVRLNRELEDTNRGVVALYAELDEKADHLRRADEMKSRFLSNMSHEFRTPLNSILALSRLLLDRTDGMLTSEQEKQVHFIRQSAQDLLELVNDLLDLAKIEAGKVVVQPVEFWVADFFSALRGMLKPLLLNNEAINLVFEEPEDIPPLYTDEGKVSQILRNFLSNALKFTERGEVRVSATHVPERDSVIFAVADTGIGISPEDQAQIFEEFAQVENPLQRRVKGTGLGLPLCRRLARLLGGNVWVESQLGLGSTFCAEIPVHFAQPPDDSQMSAESWSLDQRRLPVLVVEDEAGTQLLYEKFLKATNFQHIPARTLQDAQQILERIQPKAIILDILMGNQEAWTWLAKLKSEASTRQIPLLVVSQVEDPQKGLALGADAYGIKPIERHWLLEQLVRVTQPKERLSLLVIDDDPAVRYLLKKMLAQTSYRISEATDGREGIRLAREALPQIILLDLILPVIDGFEVLEQLKNDPVTHSIPVIILTSKSLTVEEKQRLATRAQGLLTKDTLSEEVLLEALKDIFGTAYSDSQAKPETLVGNGHNK